MEGQPAAGPSPPQQIAVDTAASMATVPSTPSTSAPGTATTASKPSGESLSPQPFSGTAAEHGNVWILYFKRFVTFRTFSKEHMLRIFPLFLRGNAIDWYDQLSEGVRGNAEQLEQAFIA